MTELFLDNQRAYPKDGTSIKINCENPFFTKAASYSMDIELPLEIEANRKIFGWLDRIDVAKEPRQMEARLVVDNVPTLIGIATITQCNERSVRVQLLGEASAYNFRNRLDELYIDELDMGSWDEYFPIVERRGRLVKAFPDPISLNNSVYGSRYPFVAYPIYNPNANALLNSVAYQRSGSQYNIIFGEDWFNGQYIYAVQPYIWSLAQNIAQATGYTLADEDNALKSHPFLSRIFMANANNYLSVAKMLPHWSVNEWWSRIEDAFGLVVEIDYSAKRIRLHHRSQFFADGQNIPIVDIVDEFTADLNDESVGDISTSNVGFADFENAPEDLLSDYISGNAVKLSGFANADTLLSWAQTNTPAYDTLYICDDGRRFIFSDDADGQPGFIEVDMFRPRIVKPKSDNVDVSLSFVPARYIDIEVPVYDVMPSGSGTGASNPHPSASRPVLARFDCQTLQAPNISELYGVEADVLDLNISAVLAGDEDEQSSQDKAGIPDVIYIAIANEQNPRVTNVSLGSYGTVPIRMPHPYLRERAVALLGAAAHVVDAPYSLSLIPISDQVNLASATIEGAPSIQVNVKHCIRFVANKIPDPSNIFLIRNKRFVCEKIEANISSDGLDKLMTGYFYSLT